MRVWLLKTSEQAPIPGTGTIRLMRAGLMAKALVDQGHEVVWWNGTFDHVTRRQQFDRDTRVEIRPGWDIWFLHGRAYRRNLSLARILNHREVARRFVMLAAGTPRPDIIVCSYPTIEFASAATDLGLRSGVPVVLDLRDMWPDIFPAHFAAWLQPAVRLATLPLRMHARRAMSRATALVGITDEFVEWGLRHARRPRAPMDRVVPLAYSASKPGPEELRAAEVFWDRHGITSERRVFTAAFVGSLGLQLDVETVIEASRQLQALGIEHRLVICGTGEKEQAHRQRAADLAHVLLPGWIKAPQLYVLLRRCHLGVNPLPSRFDFLATINNKAIEYLSYGLPVVSSPRAGALFRLLQEHNCGESYEAGDIQGLADLLRRLINDSHRLRAMSVNAQRLFEASFAAERVYTDFTTHLDTIVKAGARPMDCQRAIPKTSI